MSALPSWEQLIIKTREKLLQQRGNTEPKNVARNERHNAAVCAMHIRRGVN